MKINNEVTNHLTEEDIESLLCALNKSPLEHLKESRSRLRRELAVVDEKIRLEENNDNR